jgi:hypothetical protein
MFDRFRQKYPQGSITSSLIQIHNDQYIVSVSIKVDGVVLATTLAADEQIQIAEARATAQALQTLSIGELELSIPVSTASAPVMVEEPIDLPKSLSVEIPEEMPTPEVILETSIAAEIQDEIEPPPKATKSKKAAVVQEDPAVTYDDSLTEKLTLKPTLSVTDMIPLINMELKRLVWSREKGRDCIIELYNKRSSSLLSDEELLGLLRYLQDQPTPE